MCQRNIRYHKCIYGAYNNNKKSIFAYKFIHLVTNNKKIKLK